MENEDFDGEAAEQVPGPEQPAPPSREEFEELAAQVRRLAAQVANLRA